MAKFAGMVGIVSGATETSPGIFSPGTKEMSVRGDMTVIGMRLRQGASDTPDADPTNRLSVIANEEDFTLLSRAVYVVWMGVKWRVTKTEYQRPRALITIGGVYNG